MRNRQPISQSANYRAHVFYESSAISFYYLFITGSGLGLGNSFFFSVNIYDTRMCVCAAAR